MLRRVAVVGVLAGCAIPLAAAPASATSTDYVYGDLSAGYGHFESNGDVWSACDTKADGYGIKVDWWVPATGRSDHVWDQGGADGICAVQDVNIGEGYEVDYYVCVTRNGVELSCNQYPAKDWA
jgi:hypothetical protein